MPSADLTSVAAVKAWLGLPASSGPSDATLAALVTAASRAIYGAIGRSALLPQTYTDVYDVEGPRVFLRQWPVNSVGSVLWRGAPIAPAIGADLECSVGYNLQPADVAPPGRPQALDLFGLNLGRSRQGLVVTYTAGYAAANEPLTAPTSAPWQASALAPFGPWATDLGVAYAASGAALTPVAGSPGAGQYAVAGGRYSFNVADSGKPMLLSYGFIPQDIAQAALELAAERYRAAERIGLRSKSVGGQETIAYDISPMSAAIVAMLQPYKIVAL